MLPIDGLPGGWDEVCRLHAAAYADARGTTLLAFSEVHHHGNRTVGVTFDIVVGKGDIALDQSTPGLLDRWRWSGPAMQWWRKLLNGDARQGRLLARRDDLDRGRRVLPGPWRGADALTGIPADEAPPWMRPDSYVQQSIERGTPEDTP